MELAGSVLAIRVGAHRCFAKKMFCRVACGLLDAEVAVNMLISLKQLP